MVLCVHKMEMDTWGKRQWLISSIGFVNAAREVAVAIEEKPVVLES